MSSLPGPSSPGKRLSELLQEQQEPFLLDLFILEKRCSRKAVFSDSGRSCWPVGAWKALWSLAVRRLNSQRRKHLLRSFFKAHHPWPSPGRRREIQDGRGHGWEDPEMNERLSPVSVLEFDDHAPKKTVEGDSSLLCLEEERRPREISLDSLRPKGITKALIFSPFVEELSEEIAETQLENLVEELLRDLISV